MAVVRRTSTMGFVLIGVAVAVALVVFVAPFADGNPDGLERVSADTGIDAGAAEHRFADGPLADYRVSRADNDMVSTGIAGISGIAATFAAGAGVIWLTRRRR